MNITALDGAAVAIILFSSFLALLRGFSREILSLISWVVAAASVLFLSESILLFVEKYVSHKIVALIIILSLIFITILTLTSVITMKIADFIIGNRICLVDRSVGFIFGTLRGVLIMTISVLLINALIKPERQPHWIKHAKVKPILNSLGQKILDVLPESFYHTLEKIDKYL